MAAWDIGDMATSVRMGSKHLLSLVFIEDGQLIKSRLCVLMLNTLVMLLKSLGLFRLIPMVGVPI